MSMMSKINKMHMINKMIMMNIIEIMNNDDHDEYHIHLYYAEFYDEYDIDTKKPKNLSARQRC